MPTPDSIPRTPLVLGLAGLLPFWGLALACAATPLVGLPTLTAARLLATYAAVIVSFLGGIRWGLASVADQGRARPHYAIAVLPSLLAWAALALPATAGLAALGVLALALGPVDAAMIRAGYAPSWLARLRILLSTGAGLALLLGAALVMYRA